MSNHIQNTSPQSQVLKRAVAIGLLDVLSILGSFFLGLWLRYDFHFDAIKLEYIEFYLATIFIWCAVCVVVFALFRLYNSIWRFASFKELQRVTIATLITTILHIILITALLQRMPISYYMMGAVFQFVFIVGIRFSYRFILLLRSQKAKADADRCMMIGAGAAGQVVLRELLMVNSNEIIAVDESMEELLRRQEQIRYGIIVVSTLPIMLLYPCLQRFFAKGVMIGAVKG